MTPLCEARCDLGSCRLHERHDGDHRTRSGQTFSYEYYVAWMNTHPADEPAQSNGTPMNRAERRAANKAGKSFH
jgi:hypothetical protein